MKAIVILFFLGVRLFAASDKTDGPQSIAASLSSYSPVLTTDIFGITATSVSGVAYHPISKTLFIIDNKDSSLYEITLSGVMLRKIRLSGFEDPEDIAFHKGNSFFIVEERRGNLVETILPDTGSGPVFYDKCSISSIGTGWGNNGLEGVSYCSQTNTVFLAKEKKPPRLYTVALESAGHPQQVDADKPFPLNGMQGDVAAFYALSDGNFLLLNEQKKMLVGFNVNGEPLSELSLDMKQPEGVALDSDDGTIYIVGEPRSLGVFKKR